MTKEITSPFKVGDVVAVITAHGYGARRHIARGTILRVTKRFIEVASKDRKFKMDLEGTLPYPRPHTTWSSTYQRIEPWDKEHQTEVISNNAQHFIKTAVTNGLSDEEAIAIRALLIQMRKDAGQ